MSNETKYDVFEKALSEWDDLVHRCGLQGEEAYGYCEFDVTLSKYEKDYDAALPDDLPVIPMKIGNLIEQSVYEDATLQEALECAHDEQFRVGRWVSAHSEIFALAWLLGVWRVEGTGEIVKVEEEK